MGRITLTAMLVVGATMLHGCASMNEQECLVTDWRSVGFEDGVAGRSEGSIANYRQACSRHGVTPDLAEYRRGHAEGVEVYCRPGRGFEVGHQGRRYQGVCPSDLEPAFLETYNQGRQLYELESAVGYVNSQIAANNRRSEQLKKEIASIGAAIISDDTTSDDRARLLIESAEKASELADVGDALEALEAERTQREADLFAYQQTLAQGF